ncbi:uncharacterized protein LOC130103266 [Rhinichthys klamathensis goyatoka]|uniref:uncharacterized protein LOC130103266 n=1 Tax=Rhinichthys klamathensis goyatoka TaxID=3034132 RepID=UPI0024B56EA6|nr:uncharacterized protein LOC130103266 [Rhinichthys klamathensis goyatoka]
MAPVEEGLVPWLSGCSSSLQISIVSAFFIIIYVTLYSLCTSCFSMFDSASSSHLHRQEKRNIPLASPQNKLPESQGAEYIPAAKDLSDSDHIYSEAELNEENPYECIREPPYDKAKGENESPSTAMTKPDDNHSVSALNKQAVEQRLSSPHTHDLHLTGSVVYAAVNWKNKSTKPLFYTDTVVEMSDIAREAVPPIPDKHF